MITPRLAAFCISREAVAPTAQQAASAASQLLSSPASWLAVTLTMMKVTEAGNALGPCHEVILALAKGMDAHIGIHI